MGSLARSSLAQRYASPSLNARIGFGARRKANRNAGFELATRAGKQAKAGSLAQRLALHLARNPWSWEIPSAGQRSTDPTATPSAGMASTTTTAAASRKRSSEPSVTMPYDASVGFASVARPWLLLQGQCERRENERGVPALEVLM